MFLFPPEVITLNMIHAQQYFLLGQENNRQYFWNLKLKHQYFLFIYGYTLFPGDKFDSM